jgi:hypothetical protein
LDDAIQKVSRALESDTGSTKVGEAEVAAPKAKPTADESLAKLDDFFRDEEEPEAFMARPDFAGGPASPPPSVDPAKYEQVKPVLVEVAMKYVESIGNIEQLVGQMVGELRAAHGWTRPMLERARPCLRKFIDAVNSGAITRDELEGKAPPANIPEERHPMSVLEVQAKARAHMKEWSPKEYARLKAEGKLQTIIAHRRPPNAGPN